MSGATFYGPLPFRDVEYRGRRRQNRGAIVEALEAGTARRLHHRTGRGSHSPTGFEWGYAGSGPAELARAILLDFLAFEPTPVVYQAFKHHAIAGLQDAEWRLTAGDLRVQLRAIGRELHVACLRCLDARRTPDGADCPTCQPVPDGPDAPVFDDFMDRR